MESECYVTMPATSQARFWCFTLNNPEGMMDFSIVPDVRYAIYQHEMGDSGTPHFQGYIEFKKPKRLSWLRNRVASNAHFEMRHKRSDQQSCIAYCSKDEGRLDGPYIYGTPCTNPGGRTDVKTLKETIDSGASLTEVFDAHPNEFFKWPKGIQLGLTLKRKQRDFKPEVWLLVGPTGTGKTFFAHDRSGSQLYQKSPDKWWDGYDGQSAILLDDFYGWLPFHFLLQLLDKYPLNLEIKGATTPCLARTIYITSNKSPLQWYEKYSTVGAMAALFRRIDKFVVVPELGVYRQFSTFWEFENDLTGNVNPQTYIQ